MSAWRAFAHGWRQVARYPQVALILFAAALSSALLLALIPGEALLDLAHRPAARSAAGGIDTWLVLEALFSPNAIAGLQAGAPSAAPIEPAGLGVSALLVVGTPLLAWLVGAFLTGGLLLIFVESPRPFSFRRFVWGCWRWWGAFLLLGLLEAAFAVFVLIPSVSIGLVAALSAGGAWAWGLAAALAVLGVTWLVVVELARAAAVQANSRNLFSALAAALRLMFRKPLAVLGLYALSLLVLVLLHALFRLGLLPLLRLEQWPLVFTVQQAFIALRLVARLARLGGVAALVTLPSPGAAGISPTDSFPESFNLQSSTD